MQLSTLMDGITPLTLYISSCIKKDSSLFTVYNVMRIYDIVLVG